MDEQIVLDGENKSVFSCEVDGITKYGTAADFTAENIGSATKITLLDDFTAPGNAEIKISSNCTLDLAGKTLTFTGIKYPAGTKFAKGETVTNLGNAFTVATGKTCTISAKFVISDGATFTLTDSKEGGQIVHDSSVTPADTFSTYCQPIIHVGTGTGENANFIMNGGIIKSGDNGINIKGKAVATVNGGTVEAIGNACVFALSDCKGSDDHFNFIINGGTLITYSENRATIQSQGNSTAYIKLNGGKVIRTPSPLPLPPAAIYASNIGKIVISGTAELTSATTGIELRTGAIEMTGGKVTSTADRYTLYPFGSGETNTGSAISVAQHVSQKNVTVNISGGELCGPVALSVANPQRNPNFGEPPAGTATSYGETVNGKRVVGTVSVNITGGKFTSTNTDTSGDIDTNTVNYNNTDTTKYTFIGKNAIFNSDGRIDIPISNATIEGNLATITEIGGLSTISNGRTTENGGYIIADTTKFINTFTTPEDYNSFLSYTSEDFGYGIVVPEGWSNFNGWKGIVPVGNKIGKAVLNVVGKVSLNDLGYDLENKVFAVPEGTTTNWSASYANGGGSFYLAELNYSKHDTEVKVSSKTAGAVIRGGSSGILKDTVEKIDASENKVGLAIKGNDLDNTILGGEGADTLTGGGGVNVFGYNGGADLITDYTSDDIINLNSKIFDPVTDEKKVRNAGNNIVIDFDAGNTLEIANGLSTSVAVKSGNKFYIYDENTISQEESVTLRANFAATDYISGNYDTIDASAVGKALAITGNSNDNRIIGSNQGGTLSGGRGKDILIGGAGADTFIYTAGKDTIENYDIGDKVSIDKAIITGAKNSGGKLTFLTGRNDNALIFNTELEKIFLTTENSFLTKEGVVTNTTLKLFSGAKGRIEVSDITGIDASAVKKQSVTLVGGTGGEFTFASKNNKADVFVHKGGRDTVKNYEVGKDKIILESGLVDFSVADNNVTLKLEDDSELVLENVAGAEVNLNDPNKNKYSKMIFASDGVLKDKAKATSVTLYAGAFANGYDANADKLVKKINVVDNVAGAASITGNAQNNLIDVSKVELSGDNGFTLGGGAGNDKITGSSKADNFIYTGGKDVITNYSSGDSITLSGRDMASATKISSGNKTVTFKFDNKNKLTIKGDVAININGTSYTFDKNAIILDGAASLTSNFSGTYKAGKGITTVDGTAVKTKNFTLQGTKSDETLIGNADSNNKVTFKGGGGADSLIGGASKDTFFYAKNDRGNATVANFDYANDQIKIKRNITRIKKDSDGLTFEMGAGNTLTLTTDDKNNNVGTSNVLIKANNMLYWFDTIDGKYGLCTSTDKNLNAEIKTVMRNQNNYSVVDLNYSTNLVKAGIARASEIITFNANNYAKI